MLVLKVVNLTCGILPASKFKNALLTKLGHSVHSSARISPILLLGTTKLIAGDDSSIGALNVLRNVRVTLASRAVVGQLNWISAAPFLVNVSPSATRGQLVMHESAALMNRHYLDASGGIVLGQFAIVAGVRSTFMTHGISLEDNVLDTQEIVVGEYAMVGSNCNMVLGAVVPDFSVVAMGSTVVRGQTETYGFYAGTPAKFKSSVGNGRFFSRNVGEVLPRPAEYES